MSKTSQSGSGWWLLMIALIGGASLPTFSQADHLSYADIYPLLIDRCLNCHHNPGAPNGLSLETYELMMQGSNNGMVVIAGDSSNSEIIKRIRGERHPRMPMNGPPYLNEIEIKLMMSWIDAGAPK
ncbi:MAG: hypothetical protein HOJ23_13955 [Gammaproteobacteria bacterium]|jgi:hypothetical protein|nr:hypothetical protein [Gammaproteobacteria bacterium]